MITVEVQPPSQAQAGTLLYPPVVVSSESNADYDFVQIVLLDPYGRVLEDRLWGTLTTSTKSVDDGQVSGSSGSLEYATFPDLAITYPGTYTLRVNAVCMDYSSPDGPAAVIVSSTTTEEINCYGDPVASNVPCHSYGDYAVMADSEFLDH
ncbi:hypothetical protein DL764_002303 [Monosporascus ibericus]|uniref:Velvet domain-containing protein n=1 Tax=Monosporascus ibericus TaxID=155417 RepID=A0A4Q4TMA6_9PEZI|nr:hypothetical protein DL764_002303 [Monosporascus ibericus]